MHVGTRTSTAPAAFTGKHTVLPDGDAWRVDLDCQQCMRCGKKDFSDRTFATCIFTIVRSEADKHVSFVSSDETILLSAREIDLLRDLLDSTRPLESINKRLAKLVPAKCPEGRGACTLKHIVTNDGLFVGGQYIFHLPRYLTTLRSVRTFLAHNPICRKCAGKKEQTINTAIATVEDLQVVKRIVSTRGELDLLPAGFDALSAALLEPSADATAGDSSQSPAPAARVHSYPVDAAGLITATIHDTGDPMERLYAITVQMPFSREFLDVLVNGIRGDIAADVLLLKQQRFNDILERVVRATRVRLSRELEGTPGLELDTIVHHVAFSVLRLDELYPLLIDDNIEEIFLDAPGASLYLHHVKYQRCTTRIVLSDQAIRSLISHVRLETNRNVNDLYPTVKCVLANKLFYIRINIDVKPLCFNELALDIRRLNKKVFDIVDLIRLETLPVDLAAFLVFCIQTGHNVTIVGRPDSGKTTLLNALDMLYPPSYRKVYVEDEVETVNQDLSQRHQVKYRVARKEEKSEMIKNLLHRTPDVLILGEILTREETEALFHCLSAGLHGLQTIHANDVPSFLTRLRVHFKIDKTCIDDLGFIVFMKKLESGQRKVFDVAEFVDEDGMTKIVGLVTYDPKTQRWTRLDIASSRRVKAFLDKSRFTATDLATYLGDLECIIEKFLHDGCKPHEGLVCELSEVHARCLNDF